MSRVVGTDAAGLLAAAEVLRAGGVIIYPTETVYGLGGDAGRPDAIRRVRALKGRDDAKPVLVLTERWDRVLPWVDASGAAARRLMEHEPPLAATLLLPATAEAPAGLVGPGGAVGVRRTADAFCGGLIRAADAPLLSTSANPAGAPAPAEFGDLDAALLESVDLAVDAGRRLPGAPSTIVGFDDGRPVVRRAGAVDAATIERVAAGRG